MWLPQGFGSLQNSLPRLWQPPYTKYLSSLVFTSRWFLLTQLGRVSPLLMGGSIPIFRTLALNVCGLPAQAHNSGYIRHRPLAPLPVRLTIIILRNHTIDTLQISNIYYNSISGLLGCFAGQHTTTLYILQNTSPLAKSTRQTEYLHMSPQEAATGPAAISHKDTRGCYGNLGSLSVAPKYNTHTQLS